MDETTAPTRAVRAALDALADARVSASLVIVALVAFLAWRLVLRRHRLASAPARPSMPRSFMHRLQSSPAVRALTARFSGRLSAAAEFTHQCTQQQCIRSRASRSGQSARQRICLPEHSRCR